MSRPIWPQKSGRASDLGRRVAQLLCVLFALVGAAPVALGALIRSAPVKKWAADETARVLEQELGMRARYVVEMSLLPLSVTLRDLVVPASDGGSPALTTEALTVTPRIFSLLAGRLDVGDVEIEEPKGRIVIRDGTLKNVEYRLPKSQGPKAELKRSPFASLSVNGADLHLDLDGVEVRVGPVDVDVFAGKRLSFEVAVRAAEATLRRARPIRSVGTDQGQGQAQAFDEDIICRLDFRALLEPSSVLVRRLSMIAVADADPKPGTALDCNRAEGEDNLAQVAVRLSQLRVERAAGSKPILDGHVMLRAPAFLANRFVSTLPLKGWAGFTGQLRYDGTDTLPTLRGKLRGAGLGLDVYRIAEELDADVEIDSDIVNIPRLRMIFANGEVILHKTRLEPLAPGVPITTERGESRDIRFEALMRDVGVTPNTIVQWHLVSTKMTKIGGTIHPLHIDAEMTGQTRDFEVFDRAFHDPARRHMIGVRSAAIAARIGVRADAFNLYDVRARFGNSRLEGDLVSIGFKDTLKLSLPRKSTIDLKDISPIVDIPIAGKAVVSAMQDGRASDPHIKGDIAVEDFVFGGFPLGTIHESKVEFRPLKLDFAGARGSKGRTQYVVSSGRLDFDTSAAVLADFRVASEAMDIRDFLAMWHFEKDPRFAEIHGVGAVSADVHYAMGGPEDRCKGGYLRVDGKTDFRRLELFEERYDSGQSDFSFEWLDQRAGYLGFNLDVPSVTLKKGKGTLFGSLEVRTGAKISGNFVGTEVPISKVDALGSWAIPIDGRLGAVAEVRGRIDELETSASVSMSPVSIGSATLPGSSFTLHLKPKRQPLKVVGTTACGNPIPGPFERAEYDADKSLGVFHVSGTLFDGQVELDDLQITRQRKKTVRGRVRFSDFDVGALTELSPALALSDEKVSGRLSATLDIAELPLERQALGKARLDLAKFSAHYRGAEVELVEPKKVQMAEGRLSLPGLALAVTSPQGQRGIVDVRGEVTRLGKSPSVDAAVHLRPVQLAAFLPLIPRAYRAAGTLEGKLRLRGSPSSLAYDGQLRIATGELYLRGMSTPISNIQLELSLDDDEARIKSGSAKVGAGSLRLGGGATLRQFEPRQMRLTIGARQISLPPGAGLEGMSDADLVLLWNAAGGDKATRLPKLTGNVRLRSLQYTRRIKMTGDIDTLAQRGRRTHFEVYDPEDDFVELDLTLSSDESLKIKNNLIEAELVVAQEGLQLTGTNQRFGLRGQVKLKPGGRIRMRRNEFEIREGFVRFDDVTRIAPQVDLTAVTEYKRYNESLTDGAGDRSTSASGGHWLVKMHAYGDADKLRIDLTSEPALSQDDIFLLLTVGLTRAELDQARSASVGESVALEALGTLTGADKAVTEAVPVIDEFRLGSAYSSRTGRTEPTVTIGKRLAERIRANVTTGLAESREIRSNVEWKLTPSVSVEGSYDNVNDISSSSLGNLGADIRWRLEFD